MEQTIRAIVEANLVQKTLSLSAITHVLLELSQSLERLVLVGGGPPVVDLMSVRIPQTLAIFDFVVSRALRQQHHQLRQCEKIIAEGLAAPTDFVSRMSENKCHLEANAQFISGDALYVSLWATTLASFPTEQQTGVEAELGASLVKHGFPTQKRLSLIAEVLQEGDIINFALFDGIVPGTQLYHVVICIALLWRVQEEEVGKEAVSCLRHVVPLVLDGDGLLEQSWTRRLPSTHCVDARGTMWPDSVLNDKMAAAATAGVTSIVKVDPSSSAVLLNTALLKLPFARRVYLLEPPPVSLVREKKGEEEGSPSTLCFRAPSWYHSDQFILIRLEMAALPMQERTGLALRAVLPSVEPRLVADLRKFRYSLARAECSLVVERQLLASLACVGGSPSLKGSSEPATNEAGQNSATQAFKQQQTKIHSLETMVHDLEKEVDKIMVAADLWLPLGELVVDLWQVNRLLQEEDESTSGAHLNFTDFLGDFISPSLQQFLVTNRHHVLKPKDSLKHKAYWAMTSGQHQRKSNNNSSTSTGAAGGSSSSYALNEDQWLLLQTCEALVQAWLRAGSCSVTSKLAALLDATANHRIVPEVLKYLCSEDSQLDASSSATNTSATVSSLNGAAPAVTLPQGGSFEELEEKGRRTLALLLAMTSLLEDHPTAPEDLAESDFIKHVDWSQRASEMQRRLDSGAIRADVQIVKSQWAMVAAKDDSRLPAALQAAIDLSAALAHLQRVMAFIVPAKKVQLQAWSLRTIEGQCGTLNAEVLDCYLALKAQGDANQLLQATSKVKALQVEARRIGQTSNSLGLAEGANVDHGVLGLLSRLVLGTNLY